MLAFFSALAGIPGLLSKLWQALLVGGAYGKGRLDQRAADKLDAAQAENAARERIAAVEPTKPSDVVVKLRRGEF